MSLINDALRRSNQQKKEQAPNPSDGAPMQPVQHRQRADDSYFGPMLLIFFLGAVLTSAVWFVWKAWSAKSSKPQIASSESTPRETALVAPRSPAVPAPAPQTTVPSPQTQLQTPTAPIAAALPETNSILSNATAATEVAPPAPPPPPVLKLQGIFYRLSNPTALINGKTVGIGEKVEGARVVKISRDEVTLDRDGETVLLTLP